MTVERLAAIFNELMEQGKADAQVFVQTKDGTAPVDTVSMYFESIGIIAK